MTDPNVMRVNFKRHENGDYDPTGVVRQGIHITGLLPTVDWNPGMTIVDPSTTPGVTDWDPGMLQPGTIFSGSDTDYNGNNAASVLAHELSHAWDAAKNYYDLPDGFTNNTQFNNNRWISEIRGVQVQNATYGELDPNSKGQRNRYSGNPVPGWDQPRTWGKNADPDDPDECCKRYQNLPWRP